MAVVEARDDGEPLYSQDHFEIVAAGATDVSEYKKNVLKASTKPLINWRWLSDRVPRPVRGGKRMKGFDLARVFLLDGADFSGLDLRGADLSFSVLRNAKFHNTNLEGAVLGCSDLRGASFKECEAQWMYLRWNPT